VGQAASITEFKGQREFNFFELLNTHFDDVRCDGTEATLAFPFPCL
jgi:hypothetical protein